MSKVNNLVSVGNKGKRAKSDCYVELELSDSKGRKIDIKSKVYSMFGKSLHRLVNSILDFYELANVRLLLIDNGALELVIAARIEAAIKLLINTDKEYLLPIIDENNSISSKDQKRFSRLYLPGNTPSMMLNAGIHKPNGIILDLEDAVSFDKKYEARFLVRNTLRGINFYGAERMVRINQIPLGIKDLDFIVSNNVNLILVPKCESASQIHLLNNKIDEIKKIKGINYSIWLMPIIESALGVVKAYEIATAADNISSIAIGLEDYTADIGTLRTEEGSESFFARSTIVNACRAAGIQPIDSVFSDVSDMEALARNVKVSKSLGFDGMGCIHPRQIQVIHDNFAPEDKEILKAQKIYMAFVEAKEKGLGVISLGTKMIDAPVVKRAENTLKVAIEIGIIDSDWHTKFVN